MAKPAFVLRPPNVNDVLPYTGFLADSEVTVWLDDSAQVPISAARVESLLLRDAWCLWSIDQDGTFVGIASLYEPDPRRGTVRYSIVIGDHRVWGKGLGTAVTREVVSHAFDAIGLRKVESDVLAPNNAALALHRRVGFTEEGRLRQDAWRRGEWVDRALFSILRTDWK